MAAALVPVLTVAMVVAARSDGDDVDVSAVGLAPTFSAPAVHEGGTAVTLPDDRPVILNFFASWCAPCREELPELQRTWEDSGADVAVVGVDVADNRDKAVDLLEDTGVTFATAYDPAREVASGYRVVGMPTTVFVDAQGQVVGRVHGPLSRAALRRWVERLTEAS